MLEKIQRQLNAFCEEAKELYGTRLRSIILYGSVVSGEYIPRRSNVNILIVLDKVNFDILSKSLRIVHKWRKKANFLPLIMDQDYIKKSVDVFPMEFLDIKENYQLLYGLDLLKDIKVEAKNLRFQCEQELKGKIIRLKQAYLETGLYSAALDMVMIDSIPAIVAIFRAILRLKGKTPPVQKDQVIKNIAEMFNFNEDIGLKLLEMRSGKERLYSKAKDVLFRDWLFELESLSKLVDEQLAGK